MTTPETPLRPRRRLRYFLISLAAFAVTVALFYAEEDWRGERALEQTKHELAAQGVNMDWKSYLPAPVPEDENVFGVPEMQEGFVGHGQKELTKKWPARPNNAGRTIVAQLMIGLPGATPPAGSSVLQWGDPKTKEETIRLIKGAIGPVALDPAGYFYTKQSPGEIRVAQICFQCQTAPDEKDLQKLFPDFIFKNLWNADDKLKLERASDGTYDVTMHTPVTAAEFLKLNEPLEPQFDMIRKALQRPYARMNGDYSDPSGIPIPAFVTLRTVAQLLGAEAECHLVLGQPEEALREMTLTHDLCRRTLEENKPMTLVSGMINVAVRGLDAGIIADGLQMHAWREPQLAALQEQLKTINVLPPVQHAFRLERVSICDRLIRLTPGQFLKLFDNDDTNAWKRFEKSTVRWLIPRGWAEQNVVTSVDFCTNIMAGMDPVRQLVFPDKVADYHKHMDALYSHWSPYTFMTLQSFPNFIRAVSTTTKNQTLVNQALIACALERYRLAHGEYPETLDALTPQFIDAIPHDLIGGQPPHYRRNADGSFLLYSIGWSQQDHGGRAGDKDDCDLVWPPNW